MGALYEGPELLIPCWHSGISDSDGEVDVSLGSEQEVGSAEIQTRVTGTAAADITASGTNARTLTVVYLDDTLAVQTGTFALNGSGSPVLASFSDFYKPIAAWVSEFGTTKKNAGTLTLEKSDGSHGILKIPAGQNSWIPGRFTVPAGKRAIIRGAEVSGIAKDWFIRLVADIDPSDQSLNEGAFVTIASTQRPGVGSLMAPYDGVGSLELPAGATIKLVASHAESSQTYLLGGWFKLLLLDA